MFVAQHARECLRAGPDDNSKWIRTRIAASRPLGSESLCCQLCLCPRMLRATPAITYVPPTISDGAQSVITRSGHRLAPHGRAIRVVEAHSRGERDDFIRLPWRIYRDDPHWVPPLLLERKAFINPQKHPFYKHGEATLFIAYAGNEAVGRVLVSDDPRFNAQHQTNVGGFGMFESIDEPETSHSLLDAAERWLRGRGRSAMLGPMDYSTNYSCGLLVDGFDTPPRVMMNHNPPYYKELLTSWGLTKAKDLCAWWFADNPRIEQWRPRVERLARRSGVTIRSMRRSAGCGIAAVPACLGRWTIRPITVAACWLTASILHRA